MQVCPGVKLGWAPNCGADSSLISQPSCLQALLWKWPRTCLYILSLSVLPLHCSPISDISPHSQNVKLSFFFWRDLWGVASFERAHFSLSINRLAVHSSPPPLRQDRNHYAVTKNISRNCAFPLQQQPRCHLSCVHFFISLSEICLHVMKHLSQNLLCGYSQHFTPASIFKNLQSRLLLIVLRDINMQQTESVALSYIVSLSHVSSLICLIFRGLFTERGRGKRRQLLVAGE